MRLFHLAFALALSGIGCVLVVGAIGAPAQGAPRSAAPPSDCLTETSTLALHTASPADRPLTAAGAERCVQLDQRPRTTTAHSNAASSTGAPPAGASTSSGSRQGQGAADAVNGLARTQPGGPDPQLRGFTAGR